jgi:predicted Zn finger-like uncharacterized protein
MSRLATRCSACGTVFRVLPEQLQVSAGRVRCGRCAQVFQALHSLVDLETGMPWRDGTPGHAGVHGAAAQPDRAPVRPAAPGGPPGAGDGPSSARASAPPGDEKSTGPPDTVPVLAPSFVRQAERAARWRRPGVRAGLAGTALIAGALLAAQAAHTWREPLAVRVPLLAPLLSQACAWLGCELGAPRALQALSVESSGLVRVERSTLYELQVSLRNRARHAVAVPALDLTLTDANGALIARRVLQPADLGAGAATIAPGRDFVLQATLQAAATADGADRVINGYTVEMFYP